MCSTHHNERRIRVFRAPSILGLKPSGVEVLPDALVTPEFRRQMQILLPIIDVPTLNVHYSADRDAETGCLNTGAIRDFSRLLSNALSESVLRDEFPLVFGGDCSILLGIMPTLKTHGNYGLIFMDAHADFYLPDQSPTGEVADMELALITGRGPKELSNINNLAPYVTEQNIIHLGQRDATETRKWGAMDLSETAITHYDLATIQKKGILNIVERIKTDMGRSSLDGYWLHFDTDVLSDEVNPAVDYRLSDGLTEKEALFMLREIVNTSMIKGISITIYNPKLDPTGDAGKLISRIIVNAFNEVTNRN